MEMKSDDKRKGKKNGKKSRGKEERVIWMKVEKKGMTNKKQSERGRGRRWKKKKKNMCADSFPGKVSSRLCASDPSNRIIPNCGLFY